MGGRVYNIKMSRILFRVAASSCPDRQNESQMPESGLHIFSKVIPARFLSRPNRFIVHCETNGKKVRAYLPNPGKLRELLLPGAKVMLAENRSDHALRTRFTCVAVEREGLPIMLHTHHTNTAVRWLLDRHLVPGLGDFRVVRQEVAEGSSRFDFLLDRGDSQLLLEVKSCTLFGGPIAMFPDAVTDRGRRHVIELSHLSGRKKGGLLIVAHWPRAEYFLPDYHTDLAFARAFLDVSEKIAVIPVAVKWNADLSLSSVVKELSVPRDLLAREARDAGSYLIVLRLPRRRTLSVGSLGHVTFRTGYYVYVGSAKKNLTQRIQRHHRLRKNLFWHIDYLRNASDWVTALPIRTADDIECDLAEAVGETAQWSVPDFGASDCSCPSHLFGMENNPLISPAFIDLVERFRIRRLLPMIEQS
jgi:sugar fermentation stimulation protein A